MKFSVIIIKIWIVLFFNSCSQSETVRQITVNPPEMGSDADQNIGEAFQKLRNYAREKNILEAKILFSPGIYQLSETFVINRQVLGNFSGKLVLEGPKKGEAIIVGSSLVDGWQFANQNKVPEIAKGNLWVAELPDNVPIPKTLFDNAGMLSRARSQGFAPLPGGTDTTFSFPDGILPSKEIFHQLEVIARPSYLWSVNILPIARVDYHSRSATTLLPATYPICPISAWGDTITKSMWFENDISFIQKPGDWIANSINGKIKIYIWPRDGKQPNGIRRGRITELIRIEGDNYINEPLANIVINKLVFSQADREMLEDYDAGLQHDWDFFDKDNAMLRLRWVSDIAVENCRFEESGSSGLRADLFAQKIRISQNVFSRLGGGGILFAGYGPGTLDVNKNNVITENLIEDCGRLIWTRPGIHLWQSGENKVARNLIRNLPYSGIIISGNGPNFFKNRQNPRREQERTVRWEEIGEGPYTVESVQPFLHSRNNLIVGNEITNVLQILGDGNGIYIRYASETGNIIRGNFIHDIKQRYSAGGIRCDDLQNGVLIEGNLVYQVQHAGIFSNGKNNIKNNFIVDILNSGNVKGIETPFFRGYIVLWNDYVHGSVIDKNVFYDSGNGNPAFYYLTYAPWYNTKKPTLSKLKLEKNLYWVNQNPYWAESFVEKNIEIGIDFGSMAVNPNLKEETEKRFNFYDNCLMELGIMPFNWDSVGIPISMLSEELSM